MPEYYVHILNWPVIAESPEDAAKEAHLELGCILTGMNPIFTVTSKESKLTIWGGSDEFDSEIWGLEDKDEIS